MTEKHRIDIHYLRHTTSTNRIAYNLAMKGEAHGVAVLADAQEEGRGRLGKMWISPPGKGLYCSIIVRPRLAVEDYPKITLTAGLAVALALEKVSGLKMRLKWPNDVYTEGKKCCGILTESSSLTGNIDERFAIVGIGINVNSEEGDFPLELREKVTSLRMLSGIDYDIKDIFQQVRKVLLEYLTLLESRGFTGIITEWRKRDMLVGKWLQWLSTSGEIIYGRSEGPDDAGWLLVKDQDGKIHHILSGDISLASDVQGKRTAFSS
jgi:BirA family transcriptional regulator, biotin operon repressor / biotin---[acetyl-CoA-carboxylase] ligase